MKIITKIAFILTVLLMWRSTYAATNATDQSKESIRVVIVSISKADVIPAQVKTNTALVAGLKLVYLVEILGNKPVENLDWGPFKFTVDGKPVKLSKKSDDDTFIRALSYGKYDWKTLKKLTVSDPARASIYDISVPYFQLPKGRVDLHIETGFNRKTTTFVFKDVLIE